MPRTGSFTASKETRDPFYRRLSACGPVSTFKENGVSVVVINKSKK
jgi:hypothetical protein